MTQFIPTKAEAGDILLKQTFYKRNAINIR